MPSMMIDGREQRFCQQCGRFQDIGGCWAGRVQAACGRPQQAQRRKRLRRVGAHGQTLAA